VKYLLLEPGGKSIEISSRKLLSTKFVEEIVAVHMQLFSLPVKTIFMKNV
jgi:hypothetical protein